jgi:prepilin-type processing-associated H-X9-DG protein
MAIAGVICAGLSIFIMPALLFPVFMHARETAKQTGCLSNVKQISTAILMYSSDWDEQYPFKNNWIDSLEPYTKNRTIFNCPELQQGEGGYAFNSAMSGTRNDFTSDAAIEAMIFESRPGLNVSGGQGDMEARHSGGLIIGYADGHCKWDKLEALQGSDLVKWMPNVSAPKSGGSPPSPPATGFLGH